MIKFNEINFIMKNQDLKTKVVNRLIKWGNNPENAQKMTDEHFDYASKHYTGVSQIADVIRTI